MLHIWTVLVTTWFKTFLCTKVLAWTSMWTFFVNNIRSINYCLIVLFLHLRKILHVKYLVFTSNRHVVLGRCFGVKAAIKTEVF